MRTALFSLQKALYQRLKEDVELQLRVKGVYDYVPENALFPYVRLGEDTVIPDETKTFYGEEITHTLHIWSQYKGKKEVKEIMDIVLQSLQDPLSLEGGFSVSFTRPDYMDVIDEASGTIQHGVIRMRFKIKEGL
ncbi:DUF3168 domain-containing protein [Bacillus sp. OTU530]|uniref:DUF3168 domain-containing protein n=1 Tax=Bacillus sp. OTU530 TaxID=3043862 RepID=UPI00313E2E8B